MSIEIAFVKIFLLWLWLWLLVVVVLLFLVVLALLLVSRGYAVVGDGFKYIDDIGQFLCGGIDGGGRKIDVTGHQIEVGQQGEKEVNPDH